LVGGLEGVCVVGKGVKMVGVWRRDVFRSAVWCVFPSGEYEDGGPRCVGGCGVGASDCVSHGFAHAFMIVFRVGDVGAVPSVWGAAAAG
jgi:hypothetical protein